MGIIVSHAFTAIFGLISRAFTAVMGIISHAFTAIFGFISRAFTAVMGIIIFARGTPDSCVFFMPTGIELLSGILSLVCCLTYRACL